MITKEEIEKMLKKQQDGNKACPRCGRTSMKPTLHTNALSRQANVYVCDTCGLEEALDNMFGINKPFEEWAIICK